MVNAGANRRPWGLAFLMLTGMGALFFSSYGFANWLASQRPNVPHFYFPWEHDIPFVPWSIVPYWSIDLLYGISFFLCTTRAELLVHVKRLLAAQLISVACFIAFPLHFAFDRPIAHGLPGELFRLLAGFDKPFNQAPSLHIGLLVILWVTYARHVTGRWRGLVHLWFALIGISVLTSYQHHFIDVPTGWLVGWFCVFVFPSVPSAYVLATPQPEARKIAMYYAAAAVIAMLLSLACLDWSVVLWFILAWTSVALACVSAVYRAGAPGWFQKRPDGRMSSAARWVLAPYLAGAFANSRAWTFGKPAPGQLAERVWIGRFPCDADARRLGIDVVIDLTAELSRRTNAVALYRCIPMLDLITPTVAQLEQAVQAVSMAYADGRNILVCCALGYSRSALVAAAWLSSHLSIRCPDNALAIVRAQRLAAVLGPQARAVLAAFIERRDGAPSSGRPAVNTNGVCDAR